ncbi:aminopeptidase [bacterium]|nr:aminopeptidase [bacterium]
MRSMILILTSLAFMAGAAHADANKQTKGSFEDKFRQLEVDLPTPNTYRTASGAPGESYWQQRADYQIRATLDEAAKRLTGSQIVTYRNNSPHALSYVWFQLDQNIFKQDSIARRTETTSPGGRPGAVTDRLGLGALAREHALADTTHGFEIGKVADGAGRSLAHTIVDTMMRVDLPRPLEPGRSQSLQIEWAFNIIDQNVIGGRAGYEHFEETNTDIFFQAQWHPRLVAYTDYAGWQHKQFIGRGEFTLEFGDFDVSLTLPDDHIVASTGELQNPTQMLSPIQRARLAQAASATSPVFIVTPEEALANEREGTSGTKTWRFKASNVRDFAWASSRKFIWDAMGVDQPDGQDVMAMSFYPNEAEPLWSKYSTHAVAHTIGAYSKFSFPYPYPTAISVNTWESGGMEYPMITFNGYRPVIDKKTGERTYTRRAKYGLIGVVIHEIGHIYFPMTVNSDERQWTWMDEGINSFLQRMAELTWEETFPGRGGPVNVLDGIVDYMVSEDQQPIMTNSESISQLGANAYAKPTAALVVLRETVLGRDLFDHAFREYSKRWRFKRPTPADFFRTMEDASGVDLDWFWRGWFYTTDHVDVAISGVREYRISSKDPEVDNPAARLLREQQQPEPVTVQENRAEGEPTYLERHPELRDFYNENDEFAVTNKDRNDYTTYLEGLSVEERRTLERAVQEDPFLYFVDFANIGGLVSPLPLRFTYEDGSKRSAMIPAEVWRLNSENVTKLFIEDKKVVRIELDPEHRTADADYSNNQFPQVPVQSRLELFRFTSQQRNQMAESLVELKAKSEASPDGRDAPLAPTSGPAR